MRMLMLAVLVLCPFFKQVNCALRIRTHPRPGEKARKGAKSRPIALCEWAPVPCPAVAKRGEWGRVLFGSATSPTDWLALDQMLPHQLRESATSVLDHRILYLGGGGDNQSTHAAMVERVQSAHLVDEVVNLKEVNLSQLAVRVMDDKSVNALDKGMDYNKAMVAFLVKCLDGYDHCAWLDGDIFVHRGIVPWIDDALQRHSVDPKIPWSMPREIGRAKKTTDDIFRFDTRWFMYHREGLQRSLPLKAPSHVSRHDDMGKFENLMHHNANGVLESSHGGGTSISFSDLMKTCGPQALSTLISIVEKGSEGGEMAVDWNEHSDMMVPADWMLHIQHAMHPHCSHHTLQSGAPLLGGTNHTLQSGASLLGGTCLLASVFVWASLLG